MTSAEGVRQTERGWRASEAGKSEKVAPCEMPWVKRVDLVCDVKCWKLSCVHDDDLEK